MSSARAETLARTRARLLAARTDGGAFCGRLSESALSTATAVMAFALAARVAAHRGEPDEGKARLAEGGRAWLRRSSAWGF